MKTATALLIVATLLVLASLGDALRDPKGPCTPGTVTRLDECNTCRCLRDGFYSCTRKACVSKLVNMKVPPIGRACIPGQSFKQDCNSCVCKKDGSGAVCTLKACLPPTRGQY